MSFKVRSLGGKLILLAGLTLLLCMLLFVALSWGILTVLSEHEARGNASAHLATIRIAYKAQSADFMRNLSLVAQDPTIISIVEASPSAPLAQEQAQQIVVRAEVHYHLMLPMLDVLAGKGPVLATLNGNQEADETLPTELSALTHSAARGSAASMLQEIVLPQADESQASGKAWVLGAAVPILNHAHMPIGVVMGVQPISDGFADNLMNATGTNVALCESNHILASSMRWLNLAKYVTESSLCTIGAVSYINASQQFVTLAGFAQAQEQAPGSPLLVVVDVERVDSLAARTDRDIEILVGLGVFVLALGTFATTFITRFYFIRPLRRLQERVRSLVASNTTNVELGESSHKTDELKMLDRSFNLLSESLSIQESESVAMTKQMRDLLTMSDTLISTLNLETLLGEIVSRLGSMMNVHNVSLLLYGREMLSPWAVAHWENREPKAGEHAPIGVAQQGTVLVHADPAENITMAATTKLAAVHTPRPGQASEDRSEKQATPETTYGLRRPRIPRPALRDLDLVLARMVMQRHKIAYGEDIAHIYQERSESWCHLALEAGYRSVIAVPLLLQEQSLGAFILYTYTPRQVTSRDTFLLSTVAVQTAVAIQNAQLFAEVKDKNAALERMNHLKSQFLATVTHELRTPLHSIISYGGLLLEGFVEGELNSEQEEHIQFMVRRAEDLSHLVDEMLDLSKIEADRMEVRVEPLALESSLVEVVNQLRPMAQAKGLYLTLEAQQALPPALADSHRVKQVVLNLVSNALKFSDKGGVTIRCMLLEEYNCVRVSVHDTGIGISAAALGFIFEAFRQADGSTTRRFGGTGLGLTIARKLIELQGGEVAVESVPGQGSTFSFTLPLAPDMAAARSKVTISAHAEPALNDRRD